MKHSLFLYRVSRETQLFLIPASGKRRPCFLKLMQLQHYKPCNGLCNTAFYREGNRKISRPFKKELSDRCKRNFAHANPRPNYRQENGHKQHGTKDIGKDMRGKAIVRRNNFCGQPIRRLVRQQNERDDTRPDKRHNMKCLCPYGKPETRLKAGNQWRNDIDRNNRNNCEKNRELLFITRQFPIELHFTPSFLRKKAQNPFGFCAEPFYALQFLSAKVSYQNRRKTSNQNLQKISP